VEDCIFCRIARGEIPAEKLWENEEFYCVKDIHPAAPVHLLVIPKFHKSKEELVKGGNETFWGKMMNAVLAVVRDQKLDQVGFRIIMNGAGYNDLDHEHVHILSGIIDPSKMN
jgi:histidine triad (HIT) family protein